MGQKSVLDRVGDADASISMVTRVYDFVTVQWPILMTAFVAAGGMTYLANITSWIKSTGPAAVGATGLIFGLLTYNAIFFAQRLRAVHA